MLKEVEISLLSQLIKSLEKLQLRLEEAYEKKAYEDFEKTKKSIIQTQRKISEILK